MVGIVIGVALDTIVVFFVGYFVGMWRIVNETKKEYDAMVLEMELEGVFDDVCDKEQEN